MGRVRRQPSVEGEKLIRSERVFTVVVIWANGGREVTFCQRRDVFESIIVICVHRDRNIIIISV